MKSKSPSTEGRFAYEGLDRVIHERARLSILTSLVTNPKGLTFNDLKQLCALTDGNLSRIFVASKQLYASHYYESSVEVMAFVSGGVGDLGCPHPRPAQARPTSGGSA